VRELFPSVSYGFTTMPTYPSGQIGFMVASVDKDTVLSEPKRAVSEVLSAESEASLRYYSSEVHRAAFVLPAFAAKRLAPK
jgi:spermidine synthase